MLKLYTYATYVYMCISTSIYLYNFFIQLVDIPAIAVWQNYDFNTNVSSIVNPLKLDICVAYIDIYTCIDIYMYMCLRFIHKLFCFNTEAHNK